MEYKRIHGPQTQTISPSKLRMKLGAIHGHSPPSKLQDPDLSNGVLLQHRDDGGDEVVMPKKQTFPANQSLPGGRFPRPIPSKWYDAEKWIMGRQPARPNIIKKTLMKHTVEAPTDDASLSPAGEAKPSVTMKETGTEMTPMASQEPSRAPTPNGACTPSRTPAGSNPPTPPPADESVDDERRSTIRREILALGLQLGKMNIAAWASQAQEPAAQSWVEARFKREEAKIQAWESHEKAKAEAEMRLVETRAEKMKVEAHERMMRKLSVIKQQAGEKLAVAEARRERHAATAAGGCQDEHIRRRGGLRFCLWFL